MPDAASDPGPDTDGAARIGVHRSHVHLVAVTGSGLRSVVPDRHRQEVKHQVWIVDVRVAAAEAASFEVVRRPEPLRCSNHCTRR